MVMKQQLSILYRGMSGTLGNKVYYQLRGFTYVRKRPGYKYNDHPGPRQAATHNNFREAHLFAKSIIADRMLKAQYAAKAKPGCTAYVTALSEYLRRLKKEAVEVEALRCAPCIVTWLNG